MVDGGDRMILYDPFRNAMLGLFEMFSRGLYTFMAWTYNFMETLAGIRIFDDTQIEMFYQNLYVLIGIIMLFRLSFSVLNLIINPSGEKAKENSSVFYRVLIALVIIVLVPFGFDAAYAVQSAVLEDRLIPKFFESVISMSEGDRTDDSAADEGEDTAKETREFCYYTLDKESDSKSELYHSSEALVVFPKKSATELTKATALDRSGDAGINYLSAPVYPLDSAVNVDNKNYKVVDNWSAIEGPIADLSEGDSCPSPIYRAVTGDHALTTEANENKARYRLTGNGVAENLDIIANGKGLYIPKSEEYGYRFADSLHIVFANKLKDNISSKIDCETEAAEYQVHCDEKKKLDQERYSTRIDFVLLGHEWKEDKYDFSFLLSFATALLGSGFVLVSCFQLALRAIKMAFLQLIAPVIAVSYIQPGSQILNRWMKECIGTYLDLFIRLIGIQFSVMMVIFVDSQVLNTMFSWLLDLFILLGGLMFINETPKLLEKLTGIKLSGNFTINPLNTLKQIPVAGTVFGATTGAIGGAYAGGKAMAGTGPLGRMAGIGVGLLQGGVAGARAIPLSGAPGGKGKKPPSAGKIASEKVFHNITGQKWSDQPGMMNTIFKNLTKSTTGDLKQQKIAADNRVAHLQQAQQAIIQKNPNLMQAMVDVDRKGHGVVDVDQLRHPSVSNPALTNGDQIQADMQETLFGAGSGPLTPLQQGELQALYDDYQTYLQADADLGAAKKDAKDIEEALDTWKQLGGKNG